MRRLWVGRLIVGAFAMFVVVVLLAGGCKNRTENCWMSAAIAGGEYGESDLRVRWWPPGTECISTDGTRLD